MPDRLTFRALPIKKYNRHIQNYFSKNFKSAFSKSAVYELEISYLDCLC